jgi:RNA polymerase sigma-70 factor (ECF subfamily)
MDAPRPVDTDEELMVRYRGGERTAFEQLFARLAPRVHGFFLRSFGDVQTADDLLQQTFLKLHRAKDSYRVGDRVKPWLFAIASNVRMDELRRRMRLAEDAGEEQVDRALAAAERSEPGSSELFEGAELSARVRAALRRLPESQRVVIELNRLDGLSLGEVGQALGISEGAAKLRAFRGYEQLRRELHDLWEEQ